MTIVAKYWGSHSNTFRIRIFYSQSYCTPPHKDTPGAKIYIRTRVSDIAKSIVGYLSNPKMHTFFLPLFSILGQKSTPDFSGIPLRLKAMLQQ